MRFSFELTLSRTKQPKPICESSPAQTMLRAIQQPSVESVLIPALDAAYRGGYAAGYRDRSDGLPIDPDQHTWALKTLRDAQHAPGTN